ncbi:hypothetical protein N431DRAFT_140294 [Stipitochalara longipes BDJ]|nr:hypothetical protein N431DRAFT_140294 [Stipitochalara longipes BDJ]
MSLAHQIPALPRSYSSSLATNASDMESSSEGWTASSEVLVRHLLKKNSRSPIYKRHQKPSLVPSKYLKPEVADLARRFKLYYPKYKALHDELSSMGENRDKQKEELLLEMHARLASMKKEIIDNQQPIIDRSNDSRIESGIDRLSQRDFEARGNHSRHPGERIGSSPDSAELQHSVPNVNSELQVEEEDRSNHFGSGKYVKHKR